MDIFSELTERGLVHQSTHEDELCELLAGEGVRFYIGFDPTAPSLHVGSLVPVTLIARLQRAGHKPYILVGGATGMIGDPSGRSDERNLLDEATLAHHVERTRAQLERFVSFEGDNAAVMVNNHDWFKPITFIEFLRDVGKHITVKTMIEKKSVSARLESESGISYTEFSYMLLQAYDFVHLAREHGVKVQAGGSDQWGNITAGTELAHRMGHTDQLYGFTAPLLLDASGQKMGKTSSGTRVWLDPETTSPYAFYQYWLNTADADVERLLLIFSWRSLEDIAALVAEHAEAPHRRVGQKALAEDMTRWVHGDDAYERALAASAVMFGGSLETLGDADLEPLLADVPSSELAGAALESGAALIDQLVSVGLCKSKGEARRLIKGGGVYINNIKVEDADLALTREHLGTETMIVLRAGKKKYHVVRVVST